MTRKECVYVIRDHKAQRPVSYGPDTQVYLADGDVLKGPYTTFTAPGGEVPGFRELAPVSRDPTVSLHELAKHFGYDQFPDMPAYLMAVVMIARGRMEDAEFYLDEVRATGCGPEYIHEIRHMGETLRGI